VEPRSSHRRKLTIGVRKWYTIASINESEAVTATPHKLKKLPASSRRFAGTNFLPALLGPAPVAAACSASTWSKSSSESSCASSNSSSLGSGRAWRFPPEERGIVKVCGAVEYREQRRGNGLAKTGYLLLFVDRSEQRATSHEKGAPYFSIDPCNCPSVARLTKRNSLRRRDIAGPS